VVQADWPCFRWHPQDLVLLRVYTFPHGLLGNIQIGSLHYCKFSIWPLGGCENKSWTVQWDVLWFCSFHGHSKVKATKPRVHFTCAILDKAIVDGQNSEANITVFIVYAFCSQLLSLSDPNWLTLLYNVLFPFLWWKWNSRWENKDPLFEDEMNLIVKLLCYFCWHNVALGNFTISVYFGFSVWLEIIGLHTISVSSCTLVLYL